MKLEEYFNKHNVDKTSKHRYHNYYNPLFERVWVDRTDHREGSLRVLEIGVWKGASAKAFIDAMPGIVYRGCDIFERVGINQVEQEIKKQFPNADVELYKCDSTKVPVVKTQFSKMKKFDVIIDDGAHWPRANYSTLKNFWPYLNDGGTYVIEDIFPFHRMNTKELEHPWLKRHSDKYNWFAWNDFETHLRSLESQGHKLTEIDLRKVSGCADSFIVEIIKNG